MRENGELLDKGVPASLVSAFLNKYGIVPTGTTDFQLMFLFSMEATKGKCGRLVSILSEFKKLYDRNTPISEVLSDLVDNHKEIYKGMRIKDLRDKMFEYLVEHNLGEVLNKPYSSLSKIEITPREAYNSIVN